MTHYSNQIDAEDESRDRALAQAKAAERQRILRQIDASGSVVLATAYGPSEPIRLADIVTIMGTQNLTDLKVAVDAELARRMIPDSGNRPGREL